jgi:poly-gamma-glutamate capsule biosynthesis protein CapA/YwtB (metallophosphatase superfamily)
MITLNAVGDIMLSEKMAGVAALRKPDYLFREVKDVLSMSDFSIGNLECPLSNQGVPRERKQFIYRASPAFADHLKAAGFNILCLANNHMMDFGPIALSETISNLKRSGISIVGAGNNLDEACNPLILERNGIRIAFLAYTYATRARKREAGCCPCDPDLIQKQIEAIKRTVNLIVVSMHVGVEYVDYPNRHILYLFRRAVDSGADLVLGHHPHVVQGLEIYKGSLIAYSLGNFVSSYVDDETRRESYQNTALAYFTDEGIPLDDLRTTESFILHCEFDKCGFKNYKLLPIRSNDNFQAVLMDKNDSEIFLNKIADISRIFSDLNHPTWSEMDDLWEKCKSYGLRNMSFMFILKRLQHFRLRHLKLLIPYVKSRISDRSSPSFESSSFRRKKKSFAKDARKGKEKPVK